MNITGIGSVQTYIYNSQTGKLSTKDGTDDEFVDYFNGNIPKESTKTLNGFDAQKKGGFEVLIDVANPTSTYYVSSASNEHWIKPETNEYEITCEIMNAEESVFYVNGEEILTQCVPVTYSPEEADAWNADAPYKTHQSKAYDPITNSMNIAVGDTFNLGNGYILKVKDDHIQVIGHGNGNKNEDERVRLLEISLNAFIHFADQQWFADSIWDDQTPMLLSFLRELGIDTNREFTVNGTKCIVKNGLIEESGNPWVVPSAVRKQALQRYEEWLYEPLSTRKAIL